MITRWWKQTITLSYLKKDLNTMHLIAFIEVILYELVYNVQQMHSIKI